MRIRFLWPAAAALTALLVMFGAMLAFADTVTNDVVAGGNDTFTAGDSTTVSYKINATGGDGQPGCNADDGSAATVTISGPAGVSAVPGSLIFNYCGNPQQGVVFSSSTPGDYAITVAVSDSGVGSYNVTPGGFTLHVLPSGGGGDTTPPVITCDVGSPGPIFTLGQAGAMVNATLVDETSPLSLALSLPADTSTVGHKTVTFTGADDAGNEADPVACDYWVQYDFNGFFRPVDNMPTLNVAKAGSAIPVKFSLAGDQGLDIFAVGYPKSSSIACGDTATDGIEETVTAGGSSLSYDAASGQYNYVWKTEKAWAGTCRTLTVQLADGTVHQANFKFTK